MRKVVLLSGGMDSLVCLAEAHAAGGEIYALHLDYGQKTSVRETAAFGAICDHYGLDAGHRKIVSMAFLRQIGGSSLTDDAMAVNQAGLKPGIPSSYVPFRNSIILSLAVSWAETLDAKEVYVGANFEDSPGYPDCRPEYYEAMNRVVALGTRDGDIRLLTPVLRLHKKDVVARGRALGVPFEKSWSCYVANDRACGKCDSCLLRLKGFQENGEVDPLPQHDQGV
jgi:7-cyano-7-deazaguanine synthase